MKKCLLILVVLFLVAGSVHADDFLPPQWRGGSLSVEAEWNFDAPPNNWYEMPPSYFNSVPGHANEYLYTGFATHAQVSDPQKWMWQPINQGGGITPVSGSGGDHLSFAVQNWVDMEPWKDIRIQITGIWTNPYTLESMLGGVVGSIFVESASGQIESWSIVDSGVVGYDYTTFHAYVDLQIWPNPDWEMITAFIPEGLTIDQIYIDSISIPEPTTIALLGLGGLALIRRKRS